MMAAQRDAGLMATAGRLQEIGLERNSIIKPPTLSEMAIDKHLADRARELAAIVACFTLIGSTSLAFAQDYTGWCFDVEEGGCLSDDIRIEGRRYDTCESTCTLTNPVPVRDLNAVLFDVVCKGDWGSLTTREIFLKYPPADTDYPDSQQKLMKIGRYGAEELVRCD